MNATISTPSSLVHHIYLAWADYAACLGHPVILFIYLFFCCSGLDCRIYTKAAQKQQQQQLRSTLCVCVSVKGVKMQRVYMHSNEHFEVFTTVLAPRGELGHVCRRVSVG